MHKTFEKFQPRTAVMKTASTAGLQRNSTESSYTASSMFVHWRSRSSTRYSGGSLTWSRKWSSCVLERKRQLIFVQMLLFRYICVATRTHTHAWPTKQAVIIQKQFQQVTTYRVVIKFNVITWKYHLARLHPSWHKWCHKLVGWWVCPADGMHHALAAFTANIIHPQEVHV